MKINEVSPYFQSEEKDFILYKEDSLKLLKAFDEDTFDVVFADPPYFLSNGGITCSSGKMVSVNKGKWDTKDNVQEIFDFNYEWIKEVKRILKPNGTVWISGTFHNIYVIGFILQQLNYKILNNITWQKKNPPPNLSCRYFTHSTETILWAKKSEKAKHYFNYELMKEINDGKQMKDVWSLPIISKREKEFGNHPTQKPLNLMERIILSSTQEGDLILDPFSGSGTTGIVCFENDRRYIGIDEKEEYLNLSINRFKNAQKKLSL